MQQQQQQQCHMGLWGSLAYKIVVPVLSIALIVSFIPAVLASDTTATITLDSIVDTPDRTVTHSGATYEITDIGVYRMDQDILVGVNISDGQNFQVSLINKHENSVWGTAIDGTGAPDAPATPVTLVIPAGTVGTPGAYALAVRHQGQILVAKPVVISVYDLLISSDRVVEAGETLDVVVDVKRDGVPATINDTVKVVLSQGIASFEEIAIPAGTGRYEAGIKIPAIASGDFSLYCAITTDRTVLGYPETIGAASCEVVTVEVPAPVVQTAEMAEPEMTEPRTEVETATTASSPAETPPVISTPAARTAIEMPRAVYGLVAAATLLAIAYLIKKIILKP
jgi:hypothetical protein